MRQLDEATEFLGEVAARGGKVLFVGCKKQAQEAIKEAAQACGQFYVNQRWLGGTLTNLATIRKSIARLKYIEEIEKPPIYSKMGKQEISAVRREGEKLKRNLEGIRDMEEAAGRDRHHRHDARRRSPWRKPSAWGFRSWRSSTRTPIRS